MIVDNVQKVGIYVRELERTDLPLVNTWRNDPEVIRLLGANFLFIGPAIDERWFEGYLATRNVAVRLAVVVAETNQCIGLVSLTGIQAINRSAEFSIMLGDKAYWSRGVGKQAAVKIIQHGFNDLNLHRIYLTVLEENDRARRLYQRLGFWEEGVQQEAVYKEGSYRNVVMMALLKSAFIAND